MNRAHDGNKDTTYFPINVSQINVETVSQINEALLIFSGNVSCCTCKFPACLSLDHGECPQHTQRDCDSISSTNTTQCTNTCSSGGMFH
eukprot:m.613041 g.613041  ORF g.613041 m.613041 type:complete len:89 (+) comp22500_c2_seq15:1850-2116(+)